MIRDITKDEDILMMVSKKVDPDSDDTKRIIEDLIDTAEFHRDRCAGLAAIQIKEPYRVVVVRDGDSFIPFINPIIVNTMGGKYETEEGCMSLDGVRKVIRHRCIEVMYQTSNKKYIKKRFNGFFAEVLQHEIDHLNGKLI